MVEHAKMRVCPIAHTLEVLHPRAGRVTLFQRLASTGKTVSHEAPSGPRSA
jgi:hypothetical protein